MNSISLEHLTRVNVVGTSGSGKSTFSKSLAELVDAPYVELDSLYHKPNWQESSRAELLEKLEVAIQPERWVLDGNYHSKTFETKWSRATSIVWIDPSFTRNFLQAFSRAIRRIRTRQELWPGTGNRETFQKTFLSTDSVLLWTVTSYHRIRKRYSYYERNLGEFPHLNFYRLRGRSATEAFLKSVEQRTR